MKSSEMEEGPCLEGVSLEDGHELFLEVSSLVASFSTGYVRQKTPGCVTVV